MIEYHSKISIALLIITILTHVVSLTNTIRLIPKTKKKIAVLYQTMVVR